MSIHISPIKTETYIAHKAMGDEKSPEARSAENPDKSPDKSPDKGSDKRAAVSSKVLVASLTALGAAALAFVVLKNKKKKDLPVSEIKKYATKNLTAEEKEKLIKELQAKTDNPYVKEEIRKLIENGEWDKL